MRPHSRHGCNATNRRWVLSRWRRISPNLNKLLSILMTVVALRSRVSALPAVLMSGEIGSSTIGVCATELALSIGALLFRGRPLGRRGFTASVEADGGPGGVGSIGVTAGSSSVDPSFAPARGAILAAKASSTRLASSAQMRFLVFRMAIARSCRSPSGVVSISRMSCALIAADSSAPGLAGIFGTVAVPAWGPLGGTGAGPGLATGPLWTASASSVTSGGASRPAAVDLSCLILKPILGSFCQNHNL